MDITSYLTVEYWWRFLSWDHVLSFLTIANVLGLVGGIFYVASVSMKTIIPLRVAPGEERIELHERRCEDALMLIRSLVAVHQAFLAPRGQTKTKIPQPREMARLGAGNAFVEIDSDR